MKRVGFLVICVAVVGGLAWWLSPQRSREGPLPSPLVVRAASVSRSAQLPVRATVNVSQSLDAVSPALTLIEGDVLDWDEVGISAAKVLFQSGADRRTLSTDESGHFLARDLPTGRWELAAILAEGLGGLAPGLELDVAPGLHVAGLQFRLGRALPLEIHDREERPIAGATVEAIGNRFGLRDRLGPLPGETDVQGRHPLVVLVGDELVVHHGGFEDAHYDGAATAIAKLEAMADSSIFGATVVRMDRKGSTTEVLLRVVDQNDAPVSGAEVQLDELSPDASSRAEAFPLLRSTYQGDGGYSVRVPQPRDRALRLKAFDVWYPFHTRVEDQTIRVVRPTSAITGHVTQPNGEVVQRFGVTLDGAGHVSKTFFAWDGSFRIPTTPGAWMVRVAAPDLDSVRRTVVVVDTEDTNVDVSLAQVRTVEGVVIDRETRLAVVGASVAGPYSGVWIEGIPSDSLVETGIDGLFTVGGFPLAAAELTVHATGYAWRSVPVGVRDTHLQIELSASGSGATEWEGIGSVVGHCADREHWCFESFVPGSGARSAGLLEGDEIVSVDGTPAETDQSDLLGRVRGPAGSFVRLTVHRGDATLEFNVVRRLLRREQTSP